MLYWMRGHDESGAFYWLVRASRQSAEVLATIGRGGSAGYRWHAYVPGHRDWDTSHLSDSMTSIENLLQLTGTIYRLPGL